jgi:flagellar protein FliL
MSGASAAAEQVENGTPSKAAGWKRRLPIIAVAVAALVLVGGLWFSGVLPRVLGMARKDVDATLHQPIIVDLPEMVANLNSDPRRPRYIKLKAEIQVSRQQDAAAVHASMPQLQDLFQTYLREMRPEDLQGAIGTYRLRQELIARADVALAPARVDDVLFVEMLVQ